MEQITTPATSLRLPSGPNSELVPSSFLMVRPIDFKFNEQTAGDNEFQSKIDAEASVITARVLKEFDNFVEILRSKGINIVVHDKSHYKELAPHKTPDAVFPNNWISTETNGFLFTYPMYAPNRRLEKLAFPFIEKQLVEEKFIIKGTVCLGTTEQEQNFLEGTGCMIFDRQNRVIYGAKSLRMEDGAFQEYCKLLGYEGVSFDTESTNGKPYYHTNMIMCIGDTYVIIAKDGIKDSDRERVMEKLQKSGKEIIVITREQAEKGCCGNALQAKSEKNGKKFTVMSERAFKAFSEDQRKQVEKHDDILYANIDTIEEIGGGSARCMMCEIYLQKK